MFGLKPSDQSASHSEYAAKWRKRMEEAYRLASETAQGERDRAKERYDQKSFGAELYPGCRVLVRNMSERGGPGKLRSFWEDQVHVVTERKHQDSPVYEVKPERGSGRTRVLHRNMLLPCDFLPVEQSQPEKPKTTKSKSRTKHRDKRQVKAQLQDQQNSSEDEEDNWRVISAPSARKYGQVSGDLRAEAEEFVPQPVTADPEPDLEEEEQRQGAEEDDGLEPEANRDEPEGVEPDGENAEAADPEAGESDEADDSDPEPSSAETRKYPSRHRHPTKTLTYDSLGQPSITPRHK
ncbi:uncharacterized protein LOC133463244 [Cololabis saira]|uniref:uncharacterized protein LOC133463244 n=1 Tax=Cololabis saira TaxID=129043 RepID=UPI002AD4C2F4|nr:uncharacterized protein LOC133463244 [Cololabis saira]